jgi:hypothetical protein
LTILTYLPYHLISLLQLLTSISLFIFVLTSLQELRFLHSRAGRVVNTLLTPTATLEHIQYLLLELYEQEVEHDRLIASIERYKNVSRFDTPIIDEWEWKVATWRDREGTVVVEEGREWVFGLMD